MLDQIEALSTPKIPSSHRCPWQGFRAPCCSGACRARRCSSSVWGCLVSGVAFKETMSEVSRYSAFFGFVVTFGGVVYASPVLSVSGRMDVADRLLGASRQRGAKGARVIHQPYGRSVPGAASTSKPNATSG